jgi:hypothetical protein
VLRITEEIAVQGSATGPEDMWSCEVIARSNAFTDELARLAEMGAFEDRLARSEKTIPELAQEYRASLELMMRQAQALATSIPPK